MQAGGNFFQFRRRFFLQRDDRHIDSLTARPFQNQKRKTPVPGDESPACRVGIRVRHEMSSQELLHDSALGTLNEFDQFLHVGRTALRFPHFSNGLRGIQLRAQEQAIRALQRL